MLSSVVVLLAILGVASAAPPAQSTYCYEDNLLRAFQHTPTPASKYCITDTGYPTFLAVTSYPATRLSSACSCFSRFPTEPTSPQPTAACYQFNTVGLSSGTVVNIIITVDLTSAACPGGYLATNICGSFEGQTVTFNPSATYAAPDYCVYPSSTPFVDYGGIDWEYGNPPNTVNLYLQGVFSSINTEGIYDSYSAGLQSVSCNTKCPTS